MKNAALLLASISILLTACGPKPKSTREIETEAYTLSGQYMAANKFPEAEVALQDAIMKTKSPLLMNRLVELYSKTQQWKKMEDYVEVNGSALTWPELQDAQTALARQHFIDKNWERAARFSKRAAATETSQSGTPEQNKSCPVVAPENLRNTAAAYFNARNRRGIAEAHDALLELSNDKRCQKLESQIEIRTQAEAISKMMRDLSLLRN